MTRFTRRPPTYPERVAFLYGEIIGGLIAAIGVGLVWWVFA